jgi:hypothetical protein
MGTSKLLRRNSISLWIVLVLDLVLLGQSAGVREMTVSNPIKDKEDPFVDDFTFAHVRGIVKERRESWLWLFIPPPLF